MPWVKEDMCAGCGVCVNVCPVGAISMQEGVAVIDEKRCVRCGKCHDVCPRDAVRHDSERIPQEVEANVQWARTLRDTFESDDEKGALLERVRRHFNKEMKVVQQTLERLQELE